jgi:hypothetical protein
VPRHGLLRFARNDGIGGIELFSTNPLNCKILLDAA